MFLSNSRGDENPIRPSWTIDFHGIISSLYPMGLRLKQLLLPINIVSPNIIYYLNYAICNIDHDIFCFFSRHWRSLPQLFCYALHEVTIYDLNYKLRGGLDQYSIEKLKWETLHFPSHRNDTHPFCFLKCIHNHSHSGWPVSVCMNRYP